MIALSKVCPDCGAEYRNTAEACSDCDVPLIHPEQPQFESLGASEDLVPLVHVGPWEAGRIAETLQTSGIPSRIDTFPPKTGIDAGAFRYEGHAGRNVNVCVYVRSCDRDTAEQKLADYRASTMPGDSAEVGKDLTACPACTTVIQPGATACSDCGLEFHDPGYVCHNCGAESGADDASCPGCGVSFSA